MELIKFVLALFIIFIIGCAQKGSQNPYIQPTTKPKTHPSTQQVAALAFISYVGESMELTNKEADKKIKTCMVEELQRQTILQNQYTLAWGPKVYRFDDAKLDDNMIYAVWNKNESGNLVIALRGTNFKSISDWIYEDFYVTKTVKWEYAKPKQTNARISEATHIGFSVLKNLATIKDDSLLNLISKATQAGTLKTITVTGHSLAGALAPTFALWLKDTQSTWDANAQNEQQAVSFNVVPLAGATPGNSAFANYYDQQLGNVTNRLHNPYDVVPLAWYLPSMKSIKNIFWTSSSDIKPSYIERAAIDLGIELAKNGDYTQIKASQPTTWGQINKNANYSKFAEQAAWQHHSGYCNALDMTMPAVNSYCVDKTFCDKNPNDKKCQYLKTTDCIPI